MTQKQFYEKIAEWQRLSRNKPPKADKLKKELLQIIKDSIAGFSLDCVISSLKYLEVGTVAIIFNNNFEYAAVDYSWTEAQEEETQFVFNVPHDRFCVTTRLALIKYIEDYEKMIRKPKTPKATNKKTAKKSAPISGIYQLSFNRKRKK